VVQRPIDFKKDMAKFYGVNPALTKNVDLQMIVVRKGQENDNKVNNEFKGGSGS
jgi:hypothetical protein